MKKTLYSLLSLLIGLVILPLPFLIVGAKNLLVQFFFGFIFWIMLDLYVKVKNKCDD